MLAAVLSDSTLSALDWAVVALYLAGVAGLGFWIGRKQQSTRDYFLGGRSLPWWAAAISILATETSAVTFIGFPAAAFNGDWTLLQIFTGFVFGRLFLAFVFVRVFYEREYVTVYGFLADRYGEKTRTLAAVLFLLGRVIASSVRLYAGCLAIQIATGLPIEIIIGVVGLVGGGFTLLGGIKAVVWTDVVLGLTLVVGGLASVLFIVGAIPGGLDGVIGHEAFAEKIRAIQFDQSLSDAKGIIAGLLGGFVLTLATHGTDQDIAQRMLTCRDSRGGRLSVIASAVLILPLVVLFLSVGTLLWMYFDAGQAGFDRPDDANHVFPLFIVHELPVGLAGLVMAGLLAAALSSFTSVLNALAATTIGDFYRPLVSRRGARSEEHYVSASRVATAIWAIALIGGAIAFVGSQKSIIDLALAVLTYFYGGLLGAFLLGMLTKRGSDRSLVVAMLVSSPVVLILQFRQWVAAPKNAPGALQSWIQGFAPETIQAVQDWIPDIAFPYWIVISTTITMTIGALSGGEQRSDSSASFEKSVS